MFTTETPMADVLVEIAQATVDNAFFGPSDGRATHCLDLIGRLRSMAADELGDKATDSLAEKTVRLAVRNTRLVTANNGPLLSVAEELGVAAHNVLLHPERDWS